MVKITKKNLKLCYPQYSEIEREELGKKSIRETFITALQMGPVWLWPVKKILKHVGLIEGFEYLKEAHGKGQGVVIIAPHLGNWEVLGLFLDTCGLGVKSVLYQPPKAPELDKLIYSARSRAGSKIVPTTNKGVARVLMGLRKGEMVGVLPDQVPSLAGGEYSAFFNIDAFTMTLISRLIKKTGAKAVVACAIRQSNDNKESFKIVIKKPLEDIYSDDLSASLKALNGSIEAMVKNFPEQYQWEYKRFKRRPTDGVKIY